MTLSIGNANDYSAVVPAAIGAGTASVVMQHSGKVEKAIIKNIKKAAKKDSFKKAENVLKETAKKATSKETFKGIGKTLKGAYTKATNKEMYQNAGKVAKNVIKNLAKKETYKTAWSAIKDCGKAAYGATKNAVKAIGKDAAKFVKTTNWKTAGEYAMVAAGVVGIGIAVGKAVKSVLTQKTDA